MGFITKFLSGASSMLGFGKNNKSGLGGLLNKAKSFIASGLHNLNSRPIRNLVKIISPSIPFVGDVFNSMKKYGNIASSVLNGGAKRFSERYVKNSPLLSEIDRWDRPHHEQHHRKKDKRPTIEKGRIKDIDDEPEKQRIEVVPDERQQISAYDF